MNTETKQVNLTPYKKSVSLVVEKANSLVIKTDEQIRDASDILFQISTVGKKIKAEKEKVTRPALDIVAWARGVFGPLEKSCLEAESIIKVKMVAFNNKKEAEALKKLSKIADKVSDGSMSLEKASEHIDNAKPVNSYEGDMGAISFREHKTVVVTDATLIPRKFMIPDMTAIRSAVLAGEVIPGVLVKVEKIVAKSSR